MVHNNDNRYSDNFSHTLQRMHNIICYSLAICSSGLDSGQEVLANKHNRPFSSYHTVWSFDFSDSALTILSNQLGLSIIQNVNL